MLRKIAVAQCAEKELLRSNTRGNTGQLHGARCQSNGVQVVGSSGTKESFVPRDGNHKDDNKADVDDRPALSSTSADASWARSESQEGAIKQMGLEKTANSPHILDSSADGACEPAIAAAGETVQCSQEGCFVFADSSDDDDALCPYVCFVVD